jgi:hypothetical protein
MGLLYGRHVAFHCKPLGSVWDQQRPDPGPGGSGRRIDAKIGSTNGRLGLKSQTREIFWSSNKKDVPIVQLADLLVANRAKLEGRHSPMYWGQFEKQGDIHLSLRHQNGCSLAVCVSIRRCESR